MRIIFSIVRQRTPPPFCAGRWAVAEVSSKSSPKRRQMRRRACALARKARYFRAVTYRVSGTVNTITSPLLIIIFGKLKKKVALIFGITGQDGSYLAEFLLKKNYIIHGVKRRSSSANTERIDHLFDSLDFTNKNFFLTRF